MIVIIVNRYDFFVLVFWNFSLFHIVLRQKSIIIINNIKETDQLVIVFYYLTSLWVLSEDGVPVCLKTVVLALVSECVMGMFNPGNSMFMKIITLFSHLSVWFHYTDGSMMSCSGITQTERTTTHAHLFTQISLISSRFIPAKPQTLWLTSVSLQ